MMKSLDVKCIKPIVEAVDEIIHLQPEQYERSNYLERLNLKHTILYNRRAFYDLLEIFH